MLHSSRIALERGLKVGFQAGRENLLPALFLQMLMIALVVGYYLHWPTTALLSWLARGKEAGGFYFTFLATGFCAGVVSEVCLVCLLQKGRWRRSNLGDMAFKFTIMGFGGVGASLLYAGLAALLGNRPTVPVIAAKMIIDQFGYSTFIVSPLFMGAAHWKNCGFRPSAWGDVLTVRFIAERVVPLAVTNWCFWVPTVILIYALPLSLQLPLFLLGVSIWSLLFVSVTARRHPEMEAVRN